MTLGRVVGTVTSTVKHPTYVGHKLMVVQPIDADGSNAGDVILAVDTVQAGVGIVDAVELA
jgi:ethanolamine utilization protein EutN